MRVYYGGEDVVTKSIAKRLVQSWAYNHDKKKIECVDLNIRASGRAVLSQLNNIILLGKKTPVVFVLDSDQDCAVDLLKKYCTERADDSYSTINIAIDEGEAWLLADKIGFSDFVGVKKSTISEDIYRGKEVATPYKTSLYIMMELVPVSKKKEIRNAMSVAPNAKKPPTYNALLPDFIADKWDVDRAQKHSESLSRAVRRVETKLNMYSIRKE